MELFIKTKETQYIIAGVEDLEIRTTHGLSLEPLEDQTGFTCKENTENTEV